MANVLADLIRVSSATTGTGTITLGSAVAGFLGFSALTSGSVITYGIADGANSEVGQGTYTLSGGVQTLTRTTIYASTNSGAAINLDGLEQVYVTLSAEDIRSVDTTYGTWTPTDGSGAGLTLTKTFAQYQQTKNFVTISFTIVWPSTSNTAHVAIGNLPVTPARVGTAMGYRSAGSPVMGTINIANRINLYDMTGAILTNANMSGLVLNMTMTYTSVA